MNEPTPAQLLTEATASLRQVQEKVSMKSQELDGRILELEQEVAMLSSSAGSFRTFSPAAISNQVVQEMENTQAFGHLQAWNQGTARVSLGVGVKAALTTGGLGGAEDTSMPSQPERGGIVGQVLRPLTLLDVLPSRPVHSDSVEFVQLRTDDDADYQARQGDEKQEMEFEGALKKAHIATIAGHTTASKQVLADRENLQQKIDQTMRGKVRSRLEHQLINGDGADGHIDGFINQATVLTPTIATDNMVDVIGEALANMRTAGYSPNVVAVHPMEWLEISLLKDDEGRYLFGSPLSPATPGVWNVVLVQTPSISKGKALVLDTNYTTVLDREEASVMLSNSHKDYFTRNLIAILAELRAGLEVLDTAAVCLVELNSEAE